MKCGSTRPVAMRRSASTKRRSILTGVPRVAVTPRSTWSLVTRAKWFSTRDIVQHPGIADQFGQFDAFVGAMQAGGDQNGDAVFGDARRHHRFDHGAEEQAVRHRTGDIADQDAGAAPTLGECRQRRRIDRVFEGGMDGAGLIRQLRQGRLADHRRFGRFR